MLVAKMTVDLSKHLNYSQEQILLKFSMNFMREKQNVTHLIQTIKFKCLEL